MQKTIEQIKDELPAVKIKIGGKILMGQTTGRKNKNPKSKIHIQPKKWKGNKKNDQNFQN